MNTLKPALIVPSRNYRTFAHLILGACVVFVLGNMHGFFRGLHVGKASASQVQTEDAAVQGCGITDPVACMTQIAESVADLFRPEMVTTVIITPGSEVICADAERAYWACANDADCPLETFEAIADDLNYCQSRR